METNSLKERVAIITGGNRGLGRAAALALGSAGASLALVARDRTALEATAAEIRATGSEVEIFPTDVANEQEIGRLQRDVMARFGHADILINNAGINLRKPAEQIALAEWNQVLATNLTGAFMMCRSFVPHMKGKGYGRIINITSIMSHVSIPGRAAYCASKFGLLGFTKALALELAPSGISVVAISPGPFETEMNTHLLKDSQVSAQFLSRIPAGRWGRAEEVGRLVVYLCSPEAEFITGTDILIDGGWTAQ